MMFEKDTLGPHGDKRRLRVEVVDLTIEVTNLLASEGNRLIVKRPIYGYEGYMATEIERLQKHKGMPQVDEVELEGAAKALLHEYGMVMGGQQAHNIAYTALVGARRAKHEAGA